MNILALVDGCNQNGEIAVFLVLIIAIAIRFALSLFIGDYALCDTNGRDTPRRLKGGSPPSLRPSASLDMRLAA